jgi:serine/threonine protein kinase
MKQNAPGQVVLEHYRLTRYLGRGGAGEVWEALGPGDIPKAVKIAPIRDESDDLASRELDGLRKMRTLNHPFLLHIERFESVDDNLIVVMELAESSLKDRYAECLKAGDKGISRTELLRYKPGNLILSSGHLKVADYGLVHPHSTKAPTCTFALSPHYAPPELFDGDIEPTADQYSLAVTYQELLTGTRPYTGSSVRELLTAHYRSKPDLAALPATDRRVIAQALERDPTKRHESCMALIDQLRKSSSFSFVERPPTPAGALNGLKVIDSQLSTTPPATQSNAATVSVEVAGAEADKAGEGSGVIKPPEQRYSSTFLAFLPLQIYAHKLRGFIDELDAEMVSCSDERALLRFTKRNWFGKRILKDALFLQIDACCHNPGSGYRVIEAVVWTANQEWSSDRLRRKSDLLLKLLRCYLIAADKGDAGRAVAKAKTELLV